MRERLAETSKCQSVREGGAGSIGGRWRISKVFSEEVKLNQGFEVQVGRRKRHAQDGRASSWEGQDGKEGFPGSVEGDGSPAGSLCRVYLWELPAAWGELKAWI